jgi:hypothetical protein
MKLSDELIFITKTVEFLTFPAVKSGHAVAQLVEALRVRFPIDIILLAAL